MSLTLCTNFFSIDRIQSSANFLYKQKMHRCFICHHNSTYQRFSNQPFSHIPSNVKRPERLDCFTAEQITECLVMQYSNECFEQQNVFFTFRTTISVLFGGRCDYSSKRSFLILQNSHPNINNRTLPLHAAQNAVNCIFLYGIAGPGMRIQGIFQ